MTEYERELHAMIRTITANTLYSINEALVKWLSEDDYFKAQIRGKGLRVAKKLSALESHLLLWRAKFTIWIPDIPAHSLVYLGDEERHGVAFPKGIEDEIEELLHSTWWIGS